MRAWKCRITLASALGIEIASASPGGRSELNDVSAVILRPVDHDPVLAARRSHAHLRRSFDQSSSASRVTADVFSPMRWWHDRPQREGGPGRRAILTGALRSRIGGSSGGTPLTSYSKAKGRRTGYRAPLSFLKASPRTRKEKISNSDYKIAAWLGRELTAFATAPSGAFLLESL